MRKALSALAVLGALVATTAVSTTSAEAKYRGHGFVLHIGSGYGHGPYGGHYGNYYGGHGYGCGRFLRRWEYTGNPHWRMRYRDCIRGW